MAECKNIYDYPLRKEDLKRISNNSPGHFGKFKNSVDFGCPENTPIIAALDGIVVWLKNDSNIGGLDMKYFDEGNRIVIKHKNGEFTAYEHQRYKGAIVNVGDKVKKGQLIGYSGNTGFSSGPHLHFEVFNNPDEEMSEGDTLEIKFAKENQQ